MAQATALGTTHTGSLPSLCVHRTAPFWLMMCNRTGSGVLVACNCEAVMVSFTAALGCRRGWKLVFQIASAPAWR